MPSFEGEVAAAGRVDVERAGGQDVAIVEPGGQPMAVADLAAPAAADHAKPQSPAHPCHHTLLLKSFMMPAWRNVPRLRAAAPGVPAFLPGNPGICNGRHAAFGGVFDGGQEKA